MEFDLHTHSKYSFDSELEPQRMVEFAKKRGLNGIAITDHETVEGGKVSQIFSDLEFRVIPGIEINTKIGDVIGLFVREDIDSEDPHYVVDAIHGQDGIAILPHPFRHRVKIDFKLFDKLDGFECFNARYYNRVAPLKQISQEELREFAEAHGLAMIGVSDAHEYSEIGRGTTVIPGFSEAEIKQAIRSRATMVGRRKESPKKIVKSLLNQLLAPANELPGTEIVQGDDYYTTEPREKEPLTGEESDKE